MQTWKKLDQSKKHDSFPLLLFMIVLTLGLLSPLDRAQSSRPTDWNPKDHIPTESKPPVGRVELLTTQDFPNASAGPQRAILESDIIFVT